MKPTSKCGFTLLELSIVLVVIGLVIGGVMVGRTLIRSAEYRAQISDIEKIKTSVLSFKIKYKCLPGDCAYATRFFPEASQPSAVTNGNGDGNIEIANFVVTGGDQNTGWTDSVPASGYAEWAGVFDQLSLANLWNIAPYDEMNVSRNVRFDGIACPKPRFTSPGSPSDVGIFLVPTCVMVGYIPSYRYVSGGHKIALASGPVYAGGSGGINSWEAQALDEKADDGTPFGGKMAVMNKDYIYRIPDYPTFVDIAHLQGCNAPSENRYLSESEINSMTSPPRTRMCSLYIDADF